MNTIKKDCDLRDNQKQVVLLATHIINDFVLAKYRRLRKELDENKYDVVLLVNKNDDSDYSVSKDVACFYTDCDSLNELCYDPIEETLLPGSCHFPVLRFFLDNKRYNHYWFLSMMWSSLENGMCLWKIVMKIYLTMISFLAI